MNKETGNRNKISIQLFLQLYVKVMQKLSERILDGFVLLLLAQHPSFLIMDEPTSSLHFGNQIKIIRKVNALKNNSLGIIMATHSPDHAFMCDANVAIIHEGKIWKTGHSNDTVTEDILKEIYGVEVKVRSLGNKPECNRLVCVLTV